jgi:hypothetical protein
MVYTLRFFLLKIRVFHNSNIFGSCVIHILYTGCAKIKKNNFGSKRLISTHFTCVILFLKDAQSQFFLLNRVFCTPRRFIAYCHYRPGQDMPLRLVPFTLRYTSVVLITSCRPSGGCTLHRAGSHSWSNHCIEFIPVSFFAKTRLSV